ncbi:MAG TPA: PAS domain-containing protein [Gemmataceae bacterium]|jgi:PAS domain S-box-containing protein
MPRPDSYSHDGHEPCLHLRDFAALSALPSLWRGYDRQKVADDLASTLVKTLYLDLAYVCLRGPVGEARVEVVHGKEGLCDAEQLRTISEFLAPCLEAGAVPDPSLWAPLIGETVQATVLPIGYEGECGVLVAASRSPDFPTEADRLLLGVAANQMAMVLQQKAAVEALRRSEQELADFFENAAVGLHWVGPKGTILRVNQAELDLLGYRREEYVGRHIAEFHADPDAIAAILRRLQAGETLKDYPARLRCKDGSIKDVLLDSSVLWKDGEFIHTRCFTRDVTERRRSDAALRQSEERFARFMQHLPGLAWIKDLQGRYVYANDAAVKVFRRSRNDLYGRTDEEVFPPETAAQFTDNDQRALSSGSEVQAIETLEHEDGILHYSLVSKFPILGADSKPALSGGMAIDVTDLKRAEERKEELLALLDTLQQNAPVGFAFVDRQFRYVRINDALAAMDGRPAADLLGKTVQEAVPKLWPNLEPLYRRVLERGQPVMNQEVTGETPAAPGQVRHWLVNYYPVRVRGEVVGLGILVTDITEHKRLEGELRQRAERLTEADRLKDEFLATLAHELRNPLAPIRNALDILKQLGASGAMAEQMRDMAEQQVQHMARLLDDLLDVSRISRGRIELRKDVLDVLAVVSRSVEAVRPLFEEWQHQLTVSLPPQSLRVEADPTRLEQVLTNLLNNAAKYTDPGGRIWLTAQRIGGEVVLRVRDTGIGIAPTMLSRIFDLFVQAERRLDRSQGGVGIGLTLVKKLVELHGGTVEAHSAGPGRGSEFVVRLPAAPEGATAARGGAGSEAAVSASVPSRRVLVVDDNVSAADSIALLLQLAGHEVRVAYDGPTALLITQAFRPRVVLLDIGMPGMDGYEVARRLRQQPRLQPLLLVALTGWGHDEDKRRSKEAGFDYHLVKPTKPEAVRQLLADPKLSAPGQPAVPG